MEIKQLIELATQQGWEVGTSKKGHIVFVKGETKVYTSGSPSDYRSYLNCAAQLRQAGLDIPRKASKKKGK